MFKLELGYELCPLTKLVPKKNYHPVNIQFSVHTGFGTEGLIEMYFPIASDGQLTAGSQQLVCNIGISRLRCIRLLRPGDTKDGDQNQRKKNRFHNFIFSNNFRDKSKYSKASPKSLKMGILQGAHWEDGEKANVSAESRKDADYKTGVA
jgi:hypothetical protein